VLVSADDCRVDDEVLKIRIIRHRFEDALPHALLAPTAEPPKDAVPIAEHLWKVAPRCAGANNSEDTFYEHAIVTARRTTLVRAAYDQARYPLPLLISQDEPLHDAQGCLPKNSLESRFH